MDGPPGTGDLARIDGRAGARGKTPCSQGFGLLGGGKSKLKNVFKFYGQGFGPRGGGDHGRTAWSCLRPVGFRTLPVVLSAQVHNIHAQKSILNIFRVDPAQGGDGQGSFARVVPWLGSCPSAGHPSRPVPIQSHESPELKIDTNSSAQVAGP